tara:strand:+ start:337 stop:666 length:330 start_codon:yes stop_codon:yes gene_type:complete
MEDNDNVDENILASVSYTLYKDDEDVIIDASLGEYDKKSCDGMAKIIEVLSKETSLIHTINMIRDGLITSGQEELFLDFLTKIGKIIVDQSKKIDNDDDKPCISPIDMM